MQIKEADSESDQDKIRLIADNIDCEHYSKQAGIETNAMSCAIHYMEYGSSAGLDPRIDFNTRFYLDHNEDVRAAGVNPFYHYLVWGSKEGRISHIGSEIIDQNVVQTIVISGLIDYDWYAERNLLSLRGPTDYAHHYVAKGEKQDLRPNPVFDPAWYRATYLDNATTNALFHFATVGKEKSLDPAECFSTETYYERYPSVREAGVTALHHYLEHGIKAGLLIDPSKQARRSIKDLLVSDLDYPKPIRVIKSRSSGRCTINMVTDSVNRSSLFGGVGTALIMSALLANRRNADLCVLTTADSADSPQVEQIFESNGISLQNRLVFRDIGSGGSGRTFDYSDDDIFITTSWWSTASTLRKVPKCQIVYLLQEDERMFYDHGDRRLRCDEILHQEAILKIINTKLLFDHFRGSDPDGRRIIANSCWFEPAFPVAGKRDFQKKDIMDLFFYARPNNQRNLFYRGLEALDTVFERGFLDKNKWRLNVVGKDLPAPFPNIGVTTQIFSKLSWIDYMRVVSSMDLGLSLMYTPHPSYPPLDLVSQGAVCVTNKYGVKQDLSNYSRNIICADVGVDDIAQALLEGSRLSEDTVSRKKNFEEQNVGRDWLETFDHAISFIEARGRHV